MLTCYTGFSKVQVFITPQREVFSSPNAEHLPEVSGRKDVFLCDIHYPREASKVRWNSKRSQHLAYIACHPSFNNPILERLNCTYRGLSIMREGGWYFLDPDIQHKWYRLEQSLLWVANTLLSGGRVNLQLDFEPGPVPSSCGYLNKHVEERFARRCAMNSRDAFVPLMALCSWSISLVGASLTANKAPQWVDMLQANPTVVPSWIEDLQHSMIADFNIHRFGSFMDVTDEDVKRIIGPMLRADVPIWFYWGTASKPVMSYDRALEKYRPTHAQVDAAMIPLLQNLTVAPTVSLPKGSRQIPGEEWRSYFDRKRAKHLELELKESSMQKQKRLARENHSRTGEAPGKRAAVVFYWEKHDSGFRFRRQVPRADVAELWEDYAPTQRRYDGFADEWDICSDFDIDAIHPEDEDENDMPDIQASVAGVGLQTERPDMSPVTSGIRFPPESLDMSVWNEATPDYQPEVSLDTTASSSHDTIVDIAHYRYGLILGSALSGGVSPSLPDWDTARRALGSEAQDSINLHTKDAIRELVGNLLDVAKGEVRYPPKAIWDLNQHSDEYLFGKSNFAISLRVAESNIGTVFWIESRNLHPSRNAPWRLLVQDPATAIECLRRRWGPHLVDIAFEFYSRGIAFKTCLSDDHHITPDRPTVIGLGYRLSGYIPLKRDYETYESVRNNLLATPRARAALLKGGIIWRLAKDIVPEAAVLSGPSAEVYKTGHRVTCDNSTFWDDDLSDDELNLISGVYKVLTGELHHCANYCVGFNSA